MAYPKLLFYIIFAAFYMLCKVLVLAVLDPVDFVALQSIRKSLFDMPGSNFFSSWDFTSDPCHFPGVYCVSDRVAVLNLGDPRAGSPGLTGRLDPAIGKLSGLVELTIVPGRIVGSLPNSLSRLKNLRFLAVSRNFISGDIPATLGQLRNLKVLDLSYNQLIGPIPHSLGTIPHLSNVILCHNRLSGSVPVFLSQTLTRFDLKRNSLSGSLSPYTFSPSVQYLSLSWNRLSGPVDQLLNRLNQLNYLDLSMNRFTGEIPGRVFEYPINNLQLQRNSFSGTVEPSNRVRIETVDLSHNRLSGQISSKFLTVRNLYLNNNRFTGRVPGSLMDGGVQILYLQYNYLTGIEINSTAEISRDSTICLQFNCMNPPETLCPLKSRKRRSRPRAECNRLKG